MIKDSYISEDKNIRIYNGDCLEVMDKLIELGVKVDAIITDPPYELDNHGGGTTDLAQRKLVKDKHIDFISSGFNYDVVFNKMLKLCKIPNLLIFCSNKQVSKIMSFFENIKGLSTTLLVWNKTNPSPLCNGKHVSDLEFVVYVRGKGATFNNDVPFSYKKKLYTSPTVNSKGRFHPTQKPVELLQQYIKLHTNKDDVILDCFLGSASTGIASIIEDRKFIGIELDENYFNISKDRLIEAVEKEGDKNK